MRIGYGIDMSFERKTEWCVRQVDVSQLEETLNELCRCGFTIDRIDSPGVQTDKYVVVAVKHIVILGEDWAVAQTLQPIELEPANA